MLGGPQQRATRPRAVRGVVRPSESGQISRLSCPPGRVRPQTGHSGSARVRFRNLDVKANRCQSTALEGHLFGSPTSSDAQTLRTTAAARSPTGPFGLPGSDCVPDRVFSSIVRSDCARSLLKYPDRPDQGGQWRTATPESVTGGGDKRANPPPRPEGRPASRSDILQIGGSHGPRTRSMKPRSELPARAKMYPGKNILIWKGRSSGR